MKTIEQRQIRQMAAPVLLNYLLLTIFETLDKSIVGHYSVQGFAVIGIAETPIYEITGALGVLSSAFSMIAAQLQGKKNTADFEQAFAVTRVVSWIIGLLFLLASCIGGRFFLPAALQNRGRHFR
ncbi:MATE family efflux transporter [Faecalibacterium prausnitzii]|uniref:MATE family efflux transporter n=1 Tax=Faecalibacterium prausnitzii TaxID=853 RepID=UPI003EBCB8A9